MIRFETLRQWARTLKREVFALYLAYRDPRVPWAGRLFAGAVVAYAFSPLDLIPDFIPILGLLDDLILVPMGIWLALRMIPPEVMTESRAHAADIIRQGRPVSRAGAVAIIGLWLLLAALALAVVVRLLRGWP